MIHKLRFPATLLDASVQWKTTMRIARQRLLKAEADGYVFHIVLPGSRKLYSLTETGLHFVALYL